MIISVSNARKHHCTLVALINKIKGRDLEFCCIKTEGFMKENGIKTNGMDEVTKFSRMGASLSGCLKIIRLKDKGFTLGQSLRFMKVSGNKVSNKAMEFGRVKMETRTAASGTMVKLRVKAYIHGSTAIDTKASGRNH